MVAQIVIPPCPGSVDGPVHTKRRGDSNLHRLEKFLRFLFHSCAQAFASETAQDLADRDGTDSAFWFRQSHQRSSSQMRGEFDGSFSVGEQLENGSRLF